MTEQPIPSDAPSEYMRGYSDGVEWARQQEREECVKAIRAVCAGMYNCDATGGPVDEYIAKWRAVEAIRDLGQS